MTEDWALRELYMCNLTYSRCTSGEVYLPWDVNGTSDDAMVSDYRDVTETEFNNLVSESCRKDLEMCQEAYLDMANMTVRRSLSSQAVGWAPNSRKFARAVGYSDGSIYIAQKSNPPRNPKDAKNHDDDDMEAMPPYTSMNLNCAAYQYDAGDCVSTPETPETVETVSCNELLYSCTDEATGVNGTWDCNYFVSTIFVKIRVLKKTKSRRKS